MSKDTLQLVNVDLEFTYTHSSGKEVVIKGRVDEHGQWQQWGATRDELAENVALIEDITREIGQYLINE